MDDFTALCVELLSPLGPVRTRAMFGAQGVYVDGLFVAIVEKGELFLKADDTTRPEFVAAGCPPFTYTSKDGERMAMSYFRPPEEALESPPLMLPWARRAVEAALRAANAKAKKAPARTASGKQGGGKGATQAARKKTRTAG